MPLRLIPKNPPPPPIATNDIGKAFDIAAGDWADGAIPDHDHYQHMLTIWLDNVLNGLVQHRNIPPEDIHIDRAEIGGYTLPLVRVCGRPQAMFWSYLEKTC